MTSGTLVDRMDEVYADILSCKYTYQYIADKYGVTPATISYHAKTLREQGHIVSRRAKAISEASTLVEKAHT